MENWKVEETDLEIVIHIPKEKNVSIEELKQNLINQLNKKVEHLDGKETEVRLLEIILKNEIKKD